MKIEKLLSIEKSKEIVLSLVNGLNPITGEKLDENSLYNNSLITRSLLTMIDKINRIENKENEFSTVRLAEKQQYNIRKGLPKNNGLPWTSETIKELRKMFKSKQYVSNMAKYFQRTTRSIFRKLELEGLTPVKK